MYTYDPKANAFTIPMATMQRMIHRMTSTKDKIEAEDAKENERRIAATRGAR